MQMIESEPDVDVEVVVVVLMLVVFDNEYGRCGVEFGIVERLERLDEGKSWDKSAALVLLLVLFCDDDGKGEPRALKPLILVF